MADFKQIRKRKRIKIIYSWVGLFFLFSACGGRISEQTENTIGYNEDKNSPNETTKDSSNETPQELPNVIPQDSEIESTGYPPNDMTKSIYLTQFDYLSDGGTLVLTIKKGDKKYGLRIDAQYNSETAGRMFATNVNSIDCNECTPLRGGKLLDQGSEQESFYIDLLEEYLVENYTAEQLKLISSKDHPSGCTYEETDGWTIKKAIRLVKMPKETAVKLYSVE